MEENMKTLLFLSLISLSSIAQSDWSRECIKDRVTCKRKSIPAITFKKGKDKLIESPLTCAEYRAEEKTEKGITIKNVYIDCWVDDETRIRIKAPHEKALKLTKGVKID